MIITQNIQNFIKKIQRNVSFSNFLDGLKGFLLNLNINLTVKVVSTYLVKISFQELFDPGGIAEVRYVNNGPSI